MRRQKQGFDRPTGRMTKSQKANLLLKQQRAQRDDPAGAEDQSGAVILCGDELMRTK